MFFPHVNADSMHPPSFDRGGLSESKRVVRKARKTVRIGNRTSTRQRELRECDYRPDIAVYALENDIVDREEPYELSAGESAGSSDDSFPSGTQELMSYRLATTG